MGARRSRPIPLLQRANAMTMPLPSKKLPNQNLTGPAGEPVIMLDIVEVREGDELTIAFEESNSDWRQGVWLATSGKLEANEVSASQFTLWKDTAPTSVRVRVLATDGLLRLYNVWDSGRGIRDHESQSATSGMVIEDLPDGGRRYRCNDIGWEPKFDKLVFTVSME